MSERISPTAHYTGAVWVRHGLAHPALGSRAGRALLAVMRLPNVAFAAAGTRPHLDHMLLARHRVIDHLLDSAIRAGRVGHVVEIAAGMSGRGLRFTQAHPDLTYVEGDLPAMAAAKRRRLAGAGLLGPRHHVVPLDAMAGDGPASLRAVAAEHLDPARGCAVITEGLINYFDVHAVRALWSRIAGLLRTFPSGVYLSDAYAGDPSRRSPATRAFLLLLQAFSRGRVYLHFADEPEMQAALGDAGFAAATLHRPEAFADRVPLPRARRPHVVGILEATV